MLNQTQKRLSLTPIRGGGKTFSSLSFANQTAPMHDLSPLLTHPDFTLGVAEAERHFPKYYEPAPLTEDEMIEEVEDNLSRGSYTRGVSLKRSGLSYPSYISHLGFVYGIINEGLSYTIG